MNQKPAETDALVENMTLGGYVIDAHVVSRTQEVKCSLLKLGRPFPPGFEILEWSSSLWFRAVAGAYSYRAFRCLTGHKENDQAIDVYARTVHSPSFSCY